MGKISYTKVTKSNINNIMRDISHVETRIAKQEKKYYKTKDLSVSPKVADLEDTLYRLDALVAKASDKVWDHYLASNAVTSTDLSTAEEVA